MSDPVAEQIESADAVIGLVPPASRDDHSVETTIARILETPVETPVPLKIVLLHPPLSPNQAEPFKTNSYWHLISSPQLMRDPSSLAQSLGDSIRATFDLIWLSGWAPHQSQQQPLKPGSAKASLAEAVRGPRLPSPGGPSGAG